nr:zinc finger BED domain-containing protein RICESLEEPER 2-like [Tanacetum cinerariifolium]
MFEHGDRNKMMAWKFDQKESKKDLAHMVIVDELLFSFVEREGFRHYSKINQPLFDVPCRGTTTQDCYKLYDEEKNKLLNVIQKNTGRVCLTTDSWTSLGKKSYMALTGHFIDNEWKLNKKVLNFCRLDGHSGVDIGKGVEYCVNEWGIDAIMAVSVDNASANDSAIDFLRKTFAKKDNCLLNGKWIHIRCTAHILNLVVQDGKIIVVILVRDKCPRGKGNLPSYEVLDGFWSGDVAVACMEQKGGDDFVLWPWNSKTMTLQIHMLRTLMSSTALHYSPPQDEHHHEDRPDLLGERHEFYMLFVESEVSQTSSGEPTIWLCLVATTEDRLSSRDTANIVVLAQNLFVVEQDEHEEYVQTNNSYRRINLRRIYIMAC